MMSEAQLEMFAHVLMTRVRDRAINSCDSLAQGSTGGALGERWRNQLSSATASDAVAELIPDIVDQVLFYLLDAVDNGDLSLGFLDAGQAVPLEELGQGEMAGLLMMGEGGWIDRFSAQRFFDPLAGLD